MVTFILNSKEINTPQPAGMPLLEFIRYHQHLTGTKTGCNEGDCGACTVLVGELKDGELRYRSFTSCLTPLGNAHGKHIVTVEGINIEKPSKPANATPPLNPIQQAMCQESATQCGFCTPGFVMSMAGFCLSGKEANKQNITAAIDGNICRCTGYKSIERAANQVAALIQQNEEETPIDFAIGQQIIPAYFTSIKERLQLLLLSLNGEFSNEDKKAWFVGGGTDLYVQKHDELKDAPIHFLFDKTALNGISKEGSQCVIGSAATVTDLLESSVMQEYFPELAMHGKLISSTPIRNMATLAGNFVNASPIGDFTIFFLALNATIELGDGANKRQLPLRKFYKGYKQLDKKPEEIIEKIFFELPAKNALFSFEKVSKRTHLDIASVNSAMQILVENEVIIDASISAGGVGPIPVFLQKTSAFLRGKKVNEELIAEAISIAQTEISPISDVRGTEAYKRLLLGQLIKCHFQKFSKEKMVPVLEV